MKRKGGPRTVPLLAQVREQLAELTPSWGVEFIDGTLEGDPDAADGLVSACHNSERGEVVACLYRARLPRAAFRRALGAAWDHDHQETLEAAGSRRKLVAWFTYAAFSIPPDLPEIVTIWRGVSATTRPLAALGLSWTTRREVAAWFAMRFASPERPPLLIRRAVPRKRLVYWSDERGEGEVIPRDVDFNVEVDGAPEDWTAAAQKCAQLWKNN